jgi:hypothetical protein
MTMTTIDDLRAELRMGKYTKWAATLTPEQMIGVFWLVGEFASRASASSYDVSEGIGGERRKIGALKCLAAIKHTPMTVDDWRKLRIWDRSPQDAALDEINEAIGLIEQGKLHSAKAQLLRLREHFDNKDES